MFESTRAYPARRGASSLAALVLACAAAAVAAEAPAPAAEPAAEPAAAPAPAPAGPPARAAALHAAALQAAALQAAATPSAPSATAPDAQALLADSDTIRNPGKPFSLVVTLIEYREGRQTDTSSLQVYSKAQQAGGQYRSLLRFLSPARDANKLMLRNGNDLWFFDPSSKATIRISPQQRLLGQAANGDVVTVNLARDYHAELASQEDVQDGDRQMRPAYKLLLTASSPDVTYDHIEMWLDRQTRRPIKSKLYAPSGHLLKTAYYRHFEPQLGAERPTETVIIDGLNPNWVTIMRYSNYAWRDVPDSWLQRDYLPRFSPE